MSCEGSQSARSSSSSAHFTHLNSFMGRMVLTCHSVCCKSHSGFCPQWMTEAGCLSCSSSYCRWSPRRWWPSLLSREPASCSAIASCPPSLSLYTPLYPKVEWQIWIIKEKKWFIWLPQCPRRYFKTWKWYNHAWWFCIELNRGKEKKMLNIAFGFYLLFWNQLKLLLMFIG